MIEVQILIPVRANDGSVFSPADHDAFESQLLQLFGGFTLFAAPTIGQWIDDGKVYTDECRIYGVFLKSLADGGNIGTAAAFAKANYGQLAIAVRYLGLSEIL